MTNKCAIIELQKHYYHLLFGFISPPLLFSQLRCLPIDRRAFMRGVSEVWTGFGETRMGRGRLGKERLRRDFQRVIEIDKDKQCIPKGAECLARRGGSLTQRAMRLESQVPL